MSQRPRHTRPARSAPDAESLLERARRAGDAGRPAVAVALCRRALQAARRDGGAEALRTRIIVTLSFNLSESGDVAGALEVLDQGEGLADQHAALVAARGVVLFRAGQVGPALVHLNEAVDALSSGDRGDLATALLNRGAALMATGDLRGAQDDTAAAQSLAAGIGLGVVDFMARYNLGYLRFLTADLPGALQAMAEAEELAPEAALGVPALDRARVLLAAGLLGEASEYIDTAIATFTHNRARTDLTDSLLVGADIAIAAGDGARARTLARRAARISARRGNHAAELLARLAEQRAAAVLRRSARRSGHPAGVARTRQAAADAADLARELAAAERGQEAAVARLLAVEALLDAGDLAAATETFRPLAGAVRRLTLTGRLQGQLMSARIALASGRRTDGLRQLRRGLDDLSRFQALFGSQDLQTASAVWGRQLTSAGLRAAVETGSPAQILQWLERSRATSTRLAHLRPPADPVLAEVLGALRLAEAEARSAVLAGRPDREREREVLELRRRVRARTWTLAGSGAVGRPPTLSAVRRALGAAASAGPAPAVLAYFHGAGYVHVLVVTAGSARYHRLASLRRCEELIRMAAADLEVLAADRVPQPVRRVAGQSLAAAHAELSRRLVDPVLPAGAGPVLISGAGPLGAVAWSLLPSLAGRAVSVTTSVSASVAGLASRGPAQHRGVLAVAGPQVDRAEHEVRAVVERYPGAAALTGDAATGSAVLAGIPAGGLLHIAAHGHHESDSPLFSSVVLADGPLFAYDIAPNRALPDQIVLSSCDVGRTAVRGDGEPLGLAAALLRSGVQTVIAAVAPVSDRAAEAVMTSYHDGLAAGAGPAAALAAALPLAGEAPAPFTCFGAGFAAAAGADLVDRAARADRGDRNLDDPPGGARSGGPGGHDVPDAHGRPHRGRAPVARGSAPSAGR